MFVMWILFAQVTIVFLPLLSGQQLYDVYTWIVVDVAMSVIYTAAC